MLAGRKQSPHIANQAANTAATRFCGRRTTRSGLAGVGNLHDYGAKENRLTPHLGPPILRPIPFTRCSLKYVRQH